MTDQPQARETAAKTTTRKVLVVDDERALLRTFARFLTAKGFEVSAVSDGVTAVGCLGREEFDVVVSDINMPGLDGVQLLRAVRERDLDVPVVLMTGDPSAATAIQAVELGALRYLIKPFDLQTLISVLEDAVRLHRVAKLKRQALAVLGQTAGPGDRQGLTAGLDGALGSLWMAYQPIVSWQQKRVVAYEALVRSDDQRLPNPGALFEAAERLGRLPDLGRAIRSAVAAQIDGAGDAQVFVNLHPQDLLDVTLYDPTAPLAQYADRVVLEITERATLDEIPDVRDCIRRLRVLGFKIAVDDLGAGYAGLTSFAQLEPEWVKLDMGLIRDVHLFPNKAKIVRSMAALCREMGMQAVAEGVERVEERAVLLEAGYDLLQGYLFARPGRTFPPVAW